MPGDGPPPRSRLAFHGPLSEARAAALVARLAPVLGGETPGVVLDVGCGRAELLLRLLAAAPGACGTGIDLAADELARGREAAAARGLAGRVALHEESGHATARGPARVVLCLGASHALTPLAPPATLAAALAELRRLVEPGGRVLLGDGFWERPPTADELAAMWPGAAASDHTDLLGLVEEAVAAGFRPEWIETAGRDEWEAFESAYLADLEVWLATRPGHPDAEAARARADAHRRSWLRGYRGVLGFAYLTLVPVV